MVQFPFRIFSHRESMPPAHAAVHKRHIEKNKTKSLLLARFPKIQNQIKTISRAHVGVGGVMKMGIKILLRVGPVPHPETE